MSWMPWSTTVTSSPATTTYNNHDIENPPYNNYNNYDIESPPPYASHIKKGAPPPTFPPRKKIVPINTPPTLYNQTKRRDNYYNTSFAPVDTNAQYKKLDEEQMKEMTEAGLTFGGKRRSMSGGKRRSMRGGKKRSTKRMSGNKRRSTKRMDKGKKRSTKRMSGGKRRSSSKRR